MVKDLAGALSHFVGDPSKYKAPVGYTSNVWRPPHAATTKETEANLPQTEEAAQSKLRAYYFGLKNCSKLYYWATCLWLYGWKLRTVRPLVRLKKFHKKIQTNLEDAEAGVAMSDVGF